MSDGRQVSVRIAVRVRPFNSREKNMQSKLCVAMPNKQTLLLRNFKENDKSGKPATKTFAYDYSLWSFDKNHRGDYDGDNQYDTDRVNDNPFADQNYVYDTLGKDILKNALEGYNACLLAYGQTGSGKSYSVLNFSSPLDYEECGIIPRFCTDLFETINKKDNQEGTNTNGDGSEPATEYAITASYLEIYNEKVHDLLAQKGDASYGKNLNVRLGSDKKVFVEGLNEYPCKSIDDIMKLLEIGDKNRSVAATNMNATSSRSHSVFTINVKQTTVTKTGDSEIKKVVTSAVTLVDLAGSERAGDTGTTGQQFTEGCAINQSLSTLGLVIEALAYNCTDAGKKKPKVIPYRDSKLTYLLKDQLGGNTMVTMIAAISPADVNYEETLSTLRYVDRAKKIKSVVVKNETAEQKYIRELEAQIAELKKQLEAQGGASQNNSSSSSSSDTSSSEDVDDMKAALAEAEKRLNESKQTVEEKQAEIAAREKKMTDFLKKFRSGKAPYPHLVNLNEDPSISRTLSFKVVPVPAEKEDDGESTTECENSLGIYGFNGTYSDEYAREIMDSLKIKEANVVFYQGLSCSLGVDDNHFIIYSKRTSETFQVGGALGTPMTISKYVCYLYELEEEFPVYINGDEVPTGKPIELKHGDRILLGTSTQSNFLQFVDPSAVIELKKKNDELTKADGITRRIPQISWDAAVAEWSRKQCTGSKNKDSTDESEQIKSPEEEEISTPSSTPETKPYMPPPHHIISKEEKENILIMRKLFPLITEANAMSEFFEEGVRFSVVNKTVYENDVNNKPITSKAVVIVVKKGEHQEEWLPMRLRKNVIAMREMYADAFNLYSQRMEKIACKKLEETKDKKSDDGTIIMLSPRSTELHEEILKMRKDKKSYKDMRAEKKAEAKLIKQSAIKDIKELYHKNADASYLDDIEYPFELDSEIIIDGISQGSMPRYIGGIEFPVNPAINSRSGRMVLPIYRLGPTNPDPYKKDETQIELSDFQLYSITENDGNLMNTVKIGQSSIVLSFVVNQIRKVNPSLCRSVHAVVECLSLDDEENDDLSCQTKNKNDNESDIVNKEEENVNQPTKKSENNTCVGPTIFKPAYVQYREYLTLISKKNATLTKKSTNDSISPVLDSQVVFKFDSVDAKIMNFINSGRIRISIYGNSPNATSVSSGEASGEKIVIPSYFKKPCCGCYCLTSDAKKKLAKQEKEAKAAAKK